MNKFLQNKPPVTWPAAAAAVLLAAGAAALSVQAAGETAAPAAAGKPALTVTTVQAQRGELARAVQANGSLAAWQEAIVGAEANGLRLAEVRVNVGDVVRRGQVLARFAADMPQADLAQSKAAVAEAEATLADAAANAQRARDLQASGALSAQQINQYLTAERTAQARMAAVRAAAQVQQLRLAQTQVLAPDAGVISARSATVGAVVPAGMELFRLIRQSRLEWRAEVAASELALIQPGQAVRVTPAGGAVLAGKVRMVAPTVDAATRNGLVYVDLKPGPDSDARPGMFARGSFAFDARPALTLPAAAVLLRDGFSVVMRVGADNRVQQTKVQVLQRDADRVALQGLPADARVVARGAAFLSDGDTVRVVAEPAAPASTPASTPATTTAPAPTRTNPPAPSRAVSR